MCYFIRTVYTVCAHYNEKGPFECQAQRKRRNQWQEGGFCLSLRTSLWQCWPSLTTTELICGFCKECRDCYRGHDTRSVSAILNYWASRGYSNSVPAGSIPACKVFCDPSFVGQDLKRPRYELVALAKALPRKPSETHGQWLQRLEAARESTLEWAEKNSGTDQQSRQQPDADHAAVCTQQPPSHPSMTVPPYGHVPGSVEEVNELQEAISKRLPPPPEPRKSPYVHIETLGKLCGEVPAEFLAGQPGERDEPNMTSRFSISDTDSDDETDEPDSDSDTDDGAEAAVRAGAQQDMRHPEPGPREVSAVERSEFDDEQGECHYCAALEISPSPHGAFPVRAS